jgi:putative hydrolase of the HAD superfamily
VPITHLVFDLDDTLYPPGNGLWHDIGERINQFMIERAGIAPDQVDAVRGQYLQTHGTTLRGLMTDHPINPDEYLAFVHDIDLSRYLAPDPALEAMLAALPQPKAIFTNSDVRHTSRVLNLLGVACHFQTIVDIRAVNFENKPRPKAYEALLDRLGVPATHCIYVEDSVRNLRPAKALGMTTILVGDGSGPDPAVDFRVGTILEAGPVIQKLVNGGHL